MLQLRRVFRGVSKHDIRRNHGSVKETIFTGLSRDPKAAQKLFFVYQESRAALSRLPDCHYRRTLDATLSHRISTLTSQPSNVALVEGQFGEGRLEEVLEQAIAEKALIDKMEAWRPWEDLECQPPEGQWASPSIVTED